MVKKYDGTAQYLANKSKRPHSHPNQHTEEEKELIREKYRYHKHEGLGQVYRKCRDAGYKRSYESMCNQITVVIFTMTGERKNLYLKKF